MKMLVRRVESVFREGVSKKGDPYKIDVTRIVLDVPFNTPEGFGHKEMVYKFGDAANFAKKGLERLRGLLPLECDVELTLVMDDYNNPETVVSDIKLPQSPSVVKP